ncbi:Protein takeout [Frankliniella fusca]|uniref:Protein takeout n=1 Tax=Frankliniella fusca TaxID=407009 RepID=A0AAE1HFF5_9NEOP|nr:Protein takeout [Frankliniella fusca]
MYGASGGAPQSDSVSVTLTMLVTVTGVLAAFAAILGSSSTSAVQIPASWGTCSRSLEQGALEQCLRAAMQRALTDLSRGSAALGTRPLDPLRLQSVRLLQGEAGTGPLTLDMTFHDAEVEGLRSAEVQRVRADLARGEIVADLRAASLQLRGPYEVRGRILLIPVNGNGMGIVRMDNATMRLAIHGHVERGNDQNSRLSVDAVDFDMVPEKTHFKFINEAKATQVEIMSRIVNDNDKAIMEALRPSISATFAKEIKDYATTIFNQVAFDDVFPQ